MFKIISAILFLSLFFSLPSFASMRLYTPCKAEHGVGAAFYNFDKIIVYLAQYPEPPAGGWKRFPAEFSKDVFEKELRRVIWNNFLPCRDMPSIVLTEGKAESDMDDMLNPDNLVLFVRLTYNEHDQNDRDPADEALLITSVFRAGLAPKDALLATWLHNAYALEPHKALLEQIDYALRFGFRPQ